MGRRGATAPLLLHRLGYEICLLPISRSWNLHPSSPSVFRRLLVWTTTKAKEKKAGGSASHK